MRSRTMTRTSSVTPITPPFSVDWTGGGNPHLAARREHIRRLEATHERELQALREENQDLRRQLQTALGELISRG